MSRMIVYTKFAFQTPDGRFRRRASGPGRFAAWDEPSDPNLTSFSSLEEAVAFRNLYLATHPRNSRFILTWSIVPVQSATWVEGR